MEESWDWHTPRAFKTWGERRVDGGMNNFKIDLDFNGKKIRLWNGLIAFFSSLTASGVRIPVFTSRQVGCIFPFPC